MASTSSSTSHPIIRFDVFLSFRGEDTRYTFTDHLYHALIRAGLRTFRDNEEIDRGQELKPEIETAIIESRACVVVLSENYATSRWCLDELCLILEQRRKRNYFILPVFYHVNPSDVRNQRGCFTIDDVRRWTAALTGVANLAGMVLSGSETDFISEVVETVRCELDLKQLSTPAHLTGMENRVEVINSWLENEESNALAICGMGGSGKTTLAQQIYNLNKQHFQSSSFIEVAGKKPNEFLGLQKQLLKDVLGVGKIRISSVYEGTHKIEEVLLMKRMLIVLDDIDHDEQLSSLLGTKAFSTKSKIIITTRNLDINRWLASISWRCQLHKMKLLNDLESLELLSLFSFRSKTPMKGFEELAVQLAQYCEGNPLALKVLGSSLFVSDEDQGINMIEIWRSRIKSLNSLKGNLDYRIQGVLRKSFDSLPQPSERELFLHIACFFVGERKNFIEMILEDELYVKSGISTLINRCLLTISIDDKLMMHQLLQEMGRNVEESKDRARRSRVWHPFESYNVLRNGDGSDTIEGLSLDMRKVEQRLRSEEFTLHTKFQGNMDKLKLLQLKYVKFNGSYDKFPNLIWLCWHGCTLPKMPPGLLTITLVALDMSDGLLEKFEAPTVLNSLKTLNLKGCEKLVSICNLYRLPNLVRLILCNCSSLTHLCKTNLGKVYYLDFTGCTRLWKYVNQPDIMMHPKQSSFSIPQSLKWLALSNYGLESSSVNQPDIKMLPKQSSFSLPKSLKWLALSNCGLESNSDVCVVFHPQSYVHLNLALNPFEYLPNNINLKMLCELCLYSCQNLKYLPCIPSTLVRLHIDWCTSLERVTFQSGCFSLQYFGYECCFKLFEVQGLFKLVPIEKMDETDLGHMQWIKAYANHKVDLVGDEITKGKIWHTQMLYEYGIMSTYLQGINVPSLPTYEYTSSRGSLSFYVPFHHKKNKIQGLSINCLYTSKDKDEWNLMAKISNKTKGLTWVYNPIVFCKPRVDEYIVWVSYWPIGNILDAGDKVSVIIYVQKGKMIVHRCGASLVYMDSEVDGQETCENKSVKEEEVIGGDLSEFEVAAGCYYLCRQDLFGLNTSYWLKYFFGDNANYKGSQGWRTTHQSNFTQRRLREIENTFLKIIEMGVSFTSESEIDEIKKAVSGIVGVESVSAHKETGKLMVTGYANPVEVVTCVREFDMVAEILSFKPIIK